LKWVRGYDGGTTGNPADFQPPTPPSRIFALL
jgi:hypothetical protein